MTLKEGDMVEVALTIKSEGKVFDTTNAKLAKENDLEASPNKRLVFGKQMLLPKVEDKLKDSKEGEEFTLELGVEDAYGSRQKQLIQTYPEKVFKEQNLRIVVGQVYNFDGNYGKVKSASRGRVLVDFNHPLSGKDVEITCSLVKVIKDMKEKIELILEVMIGLSQQMFEVKVKDKTISIKVPEQLIPMKQMLENAFKEQLKEEFDGYVVELSKKDMPQQ